MSLDTPYFRQDADGRFFGNDPARGPWSPLHCHAGPVAGLAARAAEQAVGADKMLTRLTLDVLRPVPLDGLRVMADVTRLSRTVGTTRLTVTDAEGVLCVSGTSMHLTRKQLEDVPTAELPAPRFDQAEPGPGMLIGGMHDAPCFGHFTEMAFPRGQEMKPGPKTVWMRTPALLAGEDTSPIQSICPLADCGNGISWNEPPGRLGFMNTDLTLQVHREPVGGWLASEAVSHWEQNGIGMSRAVLYDTDGPIGVALQTLVLHPMR